MVSKPDPNPRHLPADPAVCEGLLPGSEGAELWHQAQLAPAQSLWLFQFFGREGTPFLRATSFLFKFSLFETLLGARFLLPPHPLAVSSSPASWTSALSWDPHFLDHGGFTAD